MSVIKGASGRIESIRKGSTHIAEIHRGAELIYRASTLRDMFNYDRGIGLGTDWIDQGPATTPHLISVHNESYARINLPDDVGVISSKTSRMRYIGGLSPTNDGWMEVGIATRGDWDGSFETIVYSHMSDTAFTHGVGLSLRGSRARLVSLVAGDKVDRTSPVSFQPGDTAHLIHSNGGDLHTLLLNGRVREQWNDSTNIASKGPGFQSYGMQMFGRKDFFLTSRRYSPGIDYIIAGGGEKRIRAIAYSNHSLFNKRTPTMSFADYVPAVNDLILVSIASSDNIGGGVTTPAGWVTPAGGSVGSDANVGRLVYHLVTPEEAAAVQTSWTVPSYLNNGTNMGVPAVVFRGVDPLDPIDAITTSFNSANLATPHLTPLIPGADLSNRSLVVGFIFADGGPTYGTPPEGWTVLLRNPAFQIGRVVLTRSALTQSSVDVLPIAMTPSIPDEYVSLAVALREAPSS